MPRYLCSVKPDTIYGAVNAFGNMDVFVAREYTSIYGVLYSAEIPIGNLTPDKYSEYIAKIKLGLLDYCFTVSNICRNTCSLQININASDYITASEHIMFELSTGKSRSNGPAL